MENSVAFHLEIEEEKKELLLGLIATLDFNGFEEKATSIIAYGKQREQQKLEQSLNAIQKMVPFQMEVEEVPAENWNALWESNFDPIIIREFCGIRATFHDPLPQVKHELIIQPKMAFGTGHHATTYMMIDFMESLDFQKANVFDFGAGTGILSILAAKLGAEKVDGLDNDPNAYQNLEENKAINNCKHINNYLGEVEQLAHQTYSIILANINRNVILKALPTLYTMLEADGHMLLSGLLHTDQSEIMKHLNLNGFRIMGEKKRSEWLAIYVKKS